MPPFTQLKDDSTACPNSWIPVTPETTWFANLDPISETLIPARLQFMRIRFLGHQGSYGILGQVINVLVDVKIWFASFHDDSTIARFRPEISRSSLVSALGQHAALQSL
jgi:hypothetical protein